MWNQCILFLRTLSPLYTSSTSSRVRINCSWCLFGNLSPFVYITILFSKLHIFQGFATSSLMLCLACRCTLLGNIIRMLASCSPQPSSISTYKRAWRLFHQFLHAVFQTVSLNTIALFIAYVYDKQYAPSTFSSGLGLLSQISWF